MSDASCPRCATPVAGDDHYCRACGWSLELAADEPPRQTDARLITRATPPHGVLPAVREDLAPLVPAIRRAATVVATAALADWALRRAGREIVRGGLARAVPALLPRNGGTNGHRLPAARPEVTETLLVERQITIRHWITRRS